MALPLFSSGATNRRQYLEFNGQSSKDFLLYLSGPGIYDSPAPDVEATSIPGLNGDLIQNNAKSGMRRFNNVDIKYKAFFFNGLPAKTAAVKSWLLSPTGYCKLADTYDPDFFRMGMCTSALTFDLSNQKAAEMELTFNCKPQRWNVAGQEVVELEAAGQTLTATGKMNVAVVTAALEMGAMNSGYYLDASGNEVATTLDIVVSDYIRVDETVYYYSGCVFDGDELSDGYPDTKVIYFFDSDKTLLGTALGFNEIGNPLSSTIDMPEGTAFVRFQGVESGVSNLIFTVYNQAVGAACNPYEFAALPIIRIYGELTEEATLYIGGTSVKLYSGASDNAGYIVLDCETQNAYYSDGTFANSVIYADEFPVFEPGNNYICWDSTEITKIEIIPRWWTL